MYNVEKHKNKNGVFPDEKRVSTQCRRVCIVTDCSFLRVSVHESICHVIGNRGKSQSDILECMFSASFGG